MERISTYRERIANWNLDSEFNFKIGKKEHKLHCRSVSMALGAIYTLSFFTAPAPLYYFGYFNLEVRLIWIFQFIPIGFFLYGQFTDNGLCMIPIAFFNFLQLIASLVIAALGLVVSVFPIFTVEEAVNFSLYFSATVTATIVAAFFFYSTKAHLKCACHLENGRLHGELLTNDDERYVSINELIRN